MTEIYGKVYDPLQPYVCHVPSVFKRTTYGGEVRYPMGWTILFSPMILKKIKFKYPSSLRHLMNEMYCLNIEKVWAMEKNRTVYI